MKKIGLKTIFQGTAWFLTFRRNIPRILLDLVLVIGTVTVGVALLAYAYLGTFSRYYADDYCMSGLVLANGFPKALSILYQTWSNRYAGMILISLSEFLGRSAIRFWAVALLALWVPTLAWTLLQAGRMARLVLSKWMALVLAVITVFFTVMESPQLYQTLFWRIGLVTYSLPLVFLTLLVGLILNGMIKASDRQRARLGLVLGLIGSFAIALFAGGFSETYVALQTGLLGLTLLLILLGAKGKTRRNGLLWLGVSLAGSLIAMLIVISAPGNAVRQANMPSSPGVLELLYSSASNAFIFIYISLRDYSFQTVLLFLLSMLLAYEFVTSNAVSLGVRPSRLVLTLLAAPVIGYLLITAICAPSVYAESSYPEQRALMEARFLMVLLVSVEGLIIGIGLGQLHKLSNEIPPFYLRAFVVLVSIAILLYPLYDARKVYAQVPEYRARAAAWDGRDTKIRSDKAQGLENIVVQEFDAVSGIQEMNSDTSFWVNGCAAQFYGVRTIEAKLP
jgi:hypothetical protein